MSVQQIGIYYIVLNHMKYIIPPNHLMMVANNHNAKTQSHRDNKNFATLRLRVKKYICCSIIYTACSLRTC